MRSDYFLQSCHTTDVKDLSMKIKLMSIHQIRRIIKKCGQIFWNACESGNLPLVKMLHKMSIKCGTSIDTTVIDDKDSNCLMIAFCSANDKVVNYLIKHGIGIHYVSSKYGNILNAICSDGYGVCHRWVERLIQKGVNSQPLDDEGNTLFLSVCRYGKLRTVKLVQSLGFNIHQCNSEGKNAIHLMCGSERNEVNLDVLKYLISLGIDVNKQANDGSTALMYARYKHAKLLLASGCNIDIIDNEGRTSLMIACSNFRWKYAKLLIEHGANIHVVDENGRNAFIEACSLGCPLSLMKMFVASGINTEYYDHRGYNALMASRFNIKKIKVFSYLLSVHTNIYHTDHNGYNIFDQLAIPNNSDDAIERLKLLLRCNVIGLHLNKITNPAVLELLTNANIINNNLECETDIQRFHVACVCGDLREVKKLVINIKKK